MPIAGLVIGLAILAYYPAREVLDAHRRGEIAAQLDTASVSLDFGKKDDLLEQAHAYNQRLAGVTPSIPLKDVLPYERQLSLDGHNTAFGYLIIPKLDLTMPLYRGASDAILSAGVGHLEWSSLPVGGPSTHSVLTAHSGMEGMRAFDDIHLLEPGDVYGIKIYGDLYCYRVTGQETVLPDEIQSLSIERGADLNTLVTCTPYGINTHRLLVHAERCEVPDGFMDENPAPQTMVKSIRVWPLIAAACVVAAIAGVRVWHVRNECKRGRE